MLQTQITGSELTALQQFLKDGGVVAVVVVFAGACGFFVWKLISKYTEIIAKGQDACDQRGAQRAAEFLEHNKTLVADNREHMGALVESVKNEQTQTRAAIDRLTQKLDGK